MIVNEFEGFFSSLLPDKRLEKRAEKVMFNMFTFGNAVINKFCNTLKEKMGAYRMLNNNKFTYEGIVEGLYRDCGRNQGADHVLCLQDTTELNYTSHIKRIGKNDKDIGPVTLNDNAGFFYHPVLSINAKTHLPLGLSSSIVWNRDWDKKDKYERNYQTQPIEEKESFRWIESADISKRVLGQTPILTFIGDREADIYEELVYVPDERTHLLIRACRNRKLFGSKDKLYETLTKSEVKAEYDLKVKGNKKRKDRIAKMTLKYTKVKVQKPEKNANKSLPEFVELWAIEAKESEATVPKGEGPILWRLLTTHELSDANACMQCVEWYNKRWLIEEFFRVLKSKGLNVEASQLESGAALKKNLMVASQVALKIMTMKLSLDNHSSEKANMLFSDDEIEFLKILTLQIEGKTAKQKNPHTIETLAWGAWSIARLSGWSGYKSHGPPGYISIKEGLQIFQNKYDGYEIALQTLKKNVYKE